MNTRCYRCGWSFSLGRETIEGAVSAAMASGTKMHAERCPHCRQVIKISVDQLRRALPAGWTPPEARVEETVANVAETNLAAESQPGQSPNGGGTSLDAAEMVEQQPKTRAKDQSGKPVAGRPAAKKNARKSTQS